MMKTNRGAQRLIGEVELFRLRIATAKSELKVLRQHARLARRRRKEAKRIAQKVRRQFKRSKAELAALEQVLAKAETRLIKAGGRALARKVAKKSPAASLPLKKPAIKQTKPKPMPELHAL